MQYKAEDILYEFRFLKLSSDSQTWKAFTEYVEVCLCTFNRLVKFPSKYANRREFIGRAWKNLIATELHWVLKYDFLVRLSVVNSVPLFREKYVSTIPE